MYATYFTWKALYDIRCIEKILLCIISFFIYPDFEPSYAGSRTSPCWEFWISDQHLGTWSRWTYRSLPYFVFGGTTRDTRRWTKNNTPSHHPHWNKYISCPIASVSKTRRILVLLTDKLNGKAVATCAVFHPRWSHHIANSCWSNSNAPATKFWW